MEQDVEGSVITVSYGTRLFQIFGTKWGTLRGIMTGAQGLKERKLKMRLKRLVASVKQFGFNPNSGRK